MKAILSRPCFLIGISGLALVILVCWLVFNLHIGKQREQFEKQAEETFQSVISRFAIVEASLDALVGLYQASHDMDTALFTPFSERILQEYRFIDSVQYLTYLTDDEKQWFIEEMKQDGFSQFVIKTLRGDDASETGPQEHHLVTSFIEPLTPSNAGLMGTDWLGEPDFRSVVHRAASLNSSALFVAPEALNKPGHVLVIKPTYFGRVVQASAEDRLEQLSGVFVAVLDWEGLARAGNAGREQVLPLVASLHGADGRLYAGADEIGGARQRHLLEVGNDRLVISAQHRWAVEQKVYLTILLAGLLTATLFALIALEVRSRFLLKQEKNRVQQQLDKERERAAVALRSIGDAVITTDIDQRVNYMNPVAERLLGHRLTEARGQTISELVTLELAPHGDTIDDPIDFYIEMTQSNLRQTGIDTVLKVDGRRVSVDGNASPLLDTRGELIGSLLVLRDVSLEQELTSQMIYQATHDSLTGLMNRAEFENRIKEALELSRQKNHQHALCYIDMDQFKLVNDTCGHVAGDELLKQVAGILQAQSAEGDLVARLGGDEFGLLIHDCTQEAAGRKAEMVRSVLHEMHFKWEDKIFDVSASIGLVMISRMSGSLAELLSAADLACYTAKDTGRNQVHVYRVDDEEIAEKYRQMQWLPRIREALKNDEFALALQSVVPLREDAEPAAISEFLLRWPQEDGHLVSPGLFIPTAERYDLMRDLDWWVIEHALAAIPHLEQCLDQPDNHMYTINLSGQSIGDPELADYIIATMQQHGISPSSLCFEVTETVAIANFSVAIEFIERLRGLGCRFALDDFGSGLSSFGYLKRLPLDFLKIDGLFVRDMLEDPVDLAMVRTIYDVARVLKLQTIAEWVEDEATLSALESIGIDYVQGFYFGKPVMISEMLEPDTRRVAHL